MNDKAFFRQEYERWNDRLNQLREDKKKLYFEKQATTKHLDEKAIDNKMDLDEAKRYVKYITQKLDTIEATKKR